jgi:hypothetical protein
MDNFEKEIKEAQTMSDILAICEKYYDLKKPLGFATKLVVTQGIKKVIQLIKAQPK